MNKSRRNFMQNVAAAGAALAAVDLMRPTQPAQAQQVTDWKKLPVLRAVLIGAGSEGYNLLQNTIRTENAIVHFTCVCDIWKYNSSRSANALAKYYTTSEPIGDRYRATGAPDKIKEYVDCDEMLAKEAKNLDIAIIATPDWMHAPHTIACLNAGLAVYCEKEMANTLEAAASMVRAARDPKRILQIGHQRRSNPRYHYAKKMVQQDRLCGRITNMMGQWNRSVKDPIPYPKNAKYWVSEEDLKKYGYPDMKSLCNWRWFRKYSGGAIADLGSHQVDIFNWFLDAMPTAVQASGGIDHYKDGREWYDNILCLLEYNTKAKEAVPDVLGPDGKTIITPGLPAVEGGPARAFYQVINTSGFGGYYEVFMGTGGTLDISEDPKHGALAREPGIRKRDWEKEAEATEKDGMQVMKFKVGESLSPTGKPQMDRLATETEKPVHQIHIENFLDAVIKKDKKILNCPPEIGYETAVSVLKINDAVEKKTRITYSPEEFIVP